ncbi:MAG: Tail-specific protease [Verrucomicrobia subdivision 3 bacterium]|nr:Tail-specific protease [Limisphaerales bacterium]MCS1412965.1 Tail-specific protease [Limisphaerales bacterium]
MKRRFLTLSLLLALAYPGSAVNLSTSGSGRISQLVGQILSSNHLRQEAFNDRLSELSLDNYFNALDVNHQVFLSSDIKEFRDKYATELDNLTLRDRNAAPAFEIYNRYLTRLRERVGKVASLLQAEHDFQIDEDLELKRSEKPWPSTTEEANELWRKRIKSDLLQGRLNKELLKPVQERLTKRYTRLLKTMDELEPDEILEIYLTAIGSAYDPHSAYMGPSTAKNFEIHNVKLELTGIGALLRSEDGYCKIVRLVPGGPAELSEQLKPNDRIVAVAQADGEPINVIEVKINKVVEMIRGERGTEVRLTVIPASSADGSELKVIPLIRDVIELKDQQVRAKIIERPSENGQQNKLGVIDLPQYYDDSARDVHLIINRLKLEGVDGIVLDLRQNGGGILDEAVKLTGLFFPKGPVVQVRDFQDSVTVLSDGDPRTAYDGPLVVLVSRSSASASEITAAALQDYGRAIIIGDQSTHGKGTVQTLQNLNQFMRRRLGAWPKDSGMLKYTISTFYRVGGKTTQKYGVQPDIVLPSIYDYMEIGEEHLPNSLEPDKIRAAEYTQLYHTKKYIPNLIDASKARVAQDQDFACVREDIDRYLELKGRQSISLNVSKRIADNEQEKARKAARKQERENRPLPKESVFLLTLDTTNEGGPLVQLPYLAAAEPEDAKEDVKPDPAISSESAGEDGENEASRKFDPHLSEALNILSDYIKALKESPPSRPDSNLS